jgi:hypothetical protein
MQPMVREWARLRGMIMLGARPSRHPVLPEILPPEMPHKSAITLGTLRFWSDTGVTRDAWLQAMRRTLKTAHILHREDDGWRWFDLEAWPWASISHAWLSVTEYHGEGRCLTRVRCILRVRRGFGWNFLLGFVIASLMMTTRQLLVIGGLGTVTAAVWVPIALWLARREMQKHARAAALAAGLQDMR